MRWTDGRQNESQLKEGRHFEKALTKTDARELRKGIGINPETDTHSESENIQ